MIESSIILNEREARRARTFLGRVQQTLSASAVIEAARTGVSPVALERHRRAVMATEKDLAKALSDYEAARAGDFSSLTDAWRGEPGVMLIIARIGRGLSQADLAAKLGLKEQQVQRYEAERYRSISLSNYRRIAAVLGVQLQANIAAGDAAWMAELAPPESAPDPAQVKKVVAHASANGWFDEPIDASEAEATILARIREVNSKLGDPIFLRTGMQNHDLSKDLLLAAYRSRVLTRAEAQVQSLSADFDPLDISWIGALVRLSVLPDGPLKAADLLREKGILMIVERHISGLKLDGAAMAVKGHPVVALTLRHDRPDNFWFTLLHELAHVVLHHRVGLNVGFYDDLEAPESDQIEDEANEFASDALIPPERWRLSAARVSKSPEVVEDFARSLSLHPAIVFGRIRRERNDYSLFSKEIGGDYARKIFEINS